MGGRRMRRRGWCGGGAHLSVVARERAAAQRGVAFVAVEGAANLSRGTIAPRQRNGLGRDREERGGGVIAGCGGGCGAAEGRTVFSNPAAPST